MITDEQAQAIYTLHREEGFLVGELFKPADVFVETPHLAQACWQLARAGLLVQSATGRGFLKLTQKALAAYDEWVISRAKFYAQPSQRRILSDGRDQ
jgi:hypothetical protein